MFCRDLDFELTSKTKRKWVRNKLRQEKGLNTLIE